MYTYHPQLAFLVVCGVVFAGSAAASAGPADDQFAVAAGHYSRGRWQWAADEFGRYIADFATDSRQQTDRALFYRGEALVQVGKYREAREQFVEFLERAPHHEYAKRALFRAAESAYLADDGPIARQALRRFRQTYPTDDLLQFVLPYLGELTFESGDTAAAQQIYVDALSRFPAGPLAEECQYGLGRALQQQGDVDAATRFFKHLASNPKTKRAEDAQLQLGVMQYNAGRYAEASKTLAAFEAAFVGSDLTGNALFWQGMSCTAMKRWPEAVSAFAEATERVDPELLPEAIFYTAQARVGAGQYDQAIPHYERILATWPEGPLADDAALGKLRALFLEGRHDAVQVQAVRFRVEFSQSPLRSQMQRLTGRSLLALGKYGPAVIVFRQLVDSHQQSSDKYLLAVAHLGASQPAAAVTALDGIPLGDSEQDFTDAVLVARASALMSLKRYTEAVEPLGAYLKSQPDGRDAADCRSELAIALAATNRLELARTAYAEYADRQTN